MWNSVRCFSAFLIASFTLANGAHAVMEEDEGGESEFVRTGFYLGVGGTAAFPDKWNSEFDDHFNKEASDLANANAQEALDSIPPPPPLPADEIIPLSVMVNGAELEDAQFGVNGVIGYRAGPLVAFEVEGEWLLSSNKTKLDVDSFYQLAEDEFLFLDSSTGSHRAEIKDIWTITANVKVYPPFIGWMKYLERFQPFAKVGVGVQHSKLVADIKTSGFTTVSSTEPIVVPADFRLKEKETNTDGVLRLGGGIDIYATRNIVSEINASYVLPFSKLGPVKTDYVSVQWRLVYRF